MPQKSTLRYLRYGFLLSILSISALQAWCAWQVYQYAHHPAALPKHADAAVVLGAAAWGDKPSPVGWPMAVTGPGAGQGLGALGPPARPFPQQDGQTPRKNDWEKHPPLS